MPYSLGSQTRNTFLVGPEAHKLHLEFKVANGAEIHRGQPVKLNAAGEAIPAVADDPAAIIIGVSIHEGQSAYGDYVTVATKGYAVIEALWSLAAESVVGPVEYAGFNNTTAYGAGTGVNPEPPQFGGYTTVKAAVAGAGNEYVNQLGWCLDKLPSGSIIRVLIKD